MDAVISFSLSGRNYVLVDFRTSKLRGVLKIKHKNISQLICILATELKDIVMQQYKMAGNRGLFDDAMNYERLSEIGNPLERILEVIDFEIFRELLETILR